MNLPREDTAGSVRAENVAATSSAMNICVRSSYGNHEKQRARSWSAAESSHIALPALHPPSEPLLSAEVH